MPQSMIPECSPPGLMSRHPRAAEPLMNVGLPIPGPVPVSEPSLQSTESDH